MSSIRVLRSLSLLPLLAAAQIAAAAVTATDLAACAACHGEDGTGREALAAPPIAGQHEAYLVDQLRAYRAGARGTDPDDAPGQSMRASALALSDEQIAALARHYATLEVPAGEARDTAEQSAGADLYAAHCATCHGEAAEGRGSVYAPNLRILDRRYLTSQLQAYANGRRAGTTRARFMTSMAALLADAAELEAVVTYIDGLQATPATRP